MEKKITNALNGLNVNQLSKILAELGVLGRSSLRKKDEKVARKSREDPSRINDYLIKYGKQPINQVKARSSTDNESPLDPKPISKRVKKRESQLRTKLKKESERVGLK